MIRELFSRLRSRLDPKGAIIPIARLFNEMGRRYFWGYAIAAFFMFLIAASAGLSAWIIGDVVDRVFVERRVDELIYLSLAVVVISMVRGIGLYGSDVAIARIGASIVARVQKQVFDHVLTLGLNYFNRTHSSELITRLSVNANSASDVLNTIVTSLGRDFFTLVGLVTVMMLKSPVVTILALVIGPPAVYGVSTLVRRLREVAKQQYKSISLTISSMQETVRGIRVVKAFRLEPVMADRIEVPIDSVRRQSNKMAQLNARTAPLMETLGGLAFAGIVLWAGYRVIYLGEEPGTLIAFITALLLAYDPAKGIAGTRVQLEASVVGLRLVYNLLDTKPTMDPNLDGPELKVANGEVVFDDVTFRYPRGAKVLRNFNFRAAPGVVTALVGPSGGGKTTIINLIERFYEVGAGSIAIDGQNIAKVKLVSLRKRMALVSQDIVLFRASIRDNIRFGRPEATDAEVEQAAKNAMAHDFIMAAPDGYDTQIEDEGTKLSGGQRQRIAIARAMLRDAPILLLDEATSSLDAESEHQVQEAFDRLMVGRTTVVIAHRLATVINADRICVIVEGQIVEEGKHADLLAAGSHYARLYRLQFERHNQQRGAEDSGQDSQVIPLPVRAPGKRKRRDQFDRIAEG